MTFTQFLNRLDRNETNPSLLELVHRDGLWPKDSNRLEDFEQFALSRLEEEDVRLIPKLRGLWHEFAQQEPHGKHDLDLALAAWGDYARHLLTCSGSRLGPCEVAEQLLEKAREQSGFDHLELSMGSTTPCDGLEDLSTEDDDGEVPEELDGEEEDDLGEEEDEQHVAADLF
jgi:hypothetical protein